MAKKNKWLDFSAFNDGWDKGDLKKSVKKSTKNISKNLKKSAKKSASSKKKKKASSKQNTKKATLEFLSSGSSKNVSRNILTGNSGIGVLGDLFDSKLGKGVENAEDKIDSALKIQNANEKRTYFNKGLFEDGYDFGDVTKTLLGTDKDVRQDLGKGVGRIGEGLLDTVAYGVGGVAKALGNDKFADKTKEFIARDLVEEGRIGESLGRSMGGTALVFDAFEGLLNKGKTEEVSALGDKSDSLVQSAGQLAGTAGLQAVGVPWWVTTGVTGFGSGAQEAFSEDASYLEAGIYGGISAGTEVAFEKIGGIKFGGKALDTGLKKQLSKAISNKVAKNLVKFGVDAGAEGFEEVATEFTQNLGRGLTYEDEKTMNELLFSEEAMDQYIEAFIGGAVMGGGFNAGKLVQSHKTGRDYDTGLTDNEQKVFDKEIENRTAEKQKKSAVETEINKVIAENEKTFGKLSESEKKLVREQVQTQFDNGELDYTTAKLTKKERAEIEKQVEEDLKSGYIGIDTIESALSGEKTSRINELRKLLSETTKDTEKSVTEAELRQLEGARAEEMKGLLEKDSLLQESYRQEALKSEAFDRKTTKEDSDITKELIESAKSAGMNNTGKMHNLFEYTNKIANDSKTKYAFVNTEQLQRLGHHKEGKTINGLVRVNEDGTSKVLINVDSDKAINTIIGHETTHLLEGTAEHKKLVDIVKEYATTKGDYDGRLKEFTKLYEGTNANIENEVTADLVGDYLFIDEQFINNLSTKEPNIFKRIYDYIKHAYKMATAGSAEARQLEQVKRKFDKAYKEISKTAKTDGNTEMLSASKKSDAAEQKETSKLPKHLIIENYVDDAGNKYDKIVLLERNIFKGKKDRGAALRDYVYKNFAGKKFTAYDGSNEVTIEFAGKNERVTKEGASNSHKVINELARKKGGRNQYIAAHADLLIAASVPDQRPYNNQSDHQWLDEKGWNYRKAYGLTPNGDVLEVLLNIANTRDGRKIFYDFNQRKNVGHGVVPTKGSHVNSNVAYSISDSTENGKKKLSIPDGEQLELKFNMTPKGIELTKEAVEYLNGISVANKTDANYVKTTAKGFMSSLIDNGTASIIGHQISSAEDLAYAAQVFRDPRYETMRYFFADDKDKVVFQTGVTSRLPGCAIVFEGEPDEYFNGLGEAAKKAGATKVWILHNHPSGDPTPSQMDISTTITLMGKFDDMGVSYQGHIVINSNKFAEIHIDTVARRASASTHNLHLGEDKLLTPEIPSRELGEYITSVDKLAQIAKAMQKDEDISSLIYTTAKGEIRAIQEFNNAYKDLEGLLKENIVNFGSPCVFIATESEEVFDNAEDLIRDGLILDAVLISGEDTTGLRGSRGVYPERNVLDEEHTAERVGGETRFSISEDIAPIRNDYKVQKATDADYMAAVEKGDMETAQRMVDEAAEAAMKHSEIRDNKGKLLKVYHGTNEQFNSFNDPNHTPYGEQGNFYFSPWRSKSEDYGDNVRAFYLNIEVPRLYDENFDELNPDEEGIDGFIFIPEDIENDIDQSKQGDTEIVAYYPDQIKSADPVTYDDNGNVIPLSERFNAGNNDIRYSLSDNIAPIRSDYKVQENPLEADGRDIDEVGSRKVKAYMYENPEVKPFFQEEAALMLTDLKEYSVKGERHYSDTLYDTGDESHGFTGTKRFIDPSIGALIDEYKYTREEVEKGLKAIIEDHGAENNAVSKRLEFLIDERLREGYTDMMTGQSMPPNEEYLNLLEDKQITEYSNEAYEAYLRSLSEETPTEPITQGGIDYINNLSREAGIDTAAVAGFYGVGSLEEMTRDQYMDAVKWLDKKAIAPVRIPEAPTEDIAPIRKDIPTSQGVQQEVKEDGSTGDVQEFTPDKTRKELQKELLAGDSNYIVKALEKAKNIPMALMNNTDTIRNNEMVLGREAGKRINEAIFQKAIDNEARSIYWQNKQRADIKALGIKARSKESAAVQKYGEGEYINEFGDLVEYGDGALMMEFPDEATQEKIKEAARVIKAKYERYIDQANAVLTGLGFDPIPKRKDYMRHFQELNDVFSKNGIPFNPQNMKEHVLPTDINGLTEFWSPQKNYFANIQPRKGKRTTLDAVTGIDGYIGGIANLIFHTEDIQRGRAYEGMIRENFGEDRGWDILESLPEDQQGARAELINNNHLSNYAAWVHEWTNNLAGKKNKIDRSVEAMFGRKGFTVLDTIRKQVGANMIGFNVASSLTNLISPLQAMAKTNKIAVMKGTADTFRNIVSKDGFVDKNAFLTARFGTDMLSKTKWEKATDAAYMFMKGIDYFSSNLIVRSKYNELIKKGMSEKEAHKEAGKFAARIMGDRTKGANAQLYNSKMVGILSQFQLEVNNQLYSMFYDTYHDSKENAKGSAAKTAAGMTFVLGQLFAFTHIFGKAFESVAGYNPTFDVLGIIATLFGVGEDDEEEKTFGERAEAAMQQLVNSLPYSSVFTGGRIPIGQALPIKQLFEGKDDYGNEKSRWETLKETAPYYLLPGGYNQIKKSIGGVEMFVGDKPVSGSYTDSGNLRFPVEETPMNVVHAAIFGKWANKNAQDYIDNERLPLKEKQIQEYKNLDLPIKDYWNYRDGLSKQETLEEKFDYVAGLDVSVRQKNIMINNIVDREDRADMTDYSDFGSYEEFDFASKYPEKYAIAKAVGFSTYMVCSEDLYNLRADKDQYGNSIRNSRKAKVIDYINGLDIDYEAKLILYKKEYPSDDANNQEIIDYLNSRDDISYQDMESILTELGFTVTSDGTIYW